MTNSAVQSWIIAYESHSVGEPGTLVSLHSCPATPSKQMAAPQTMTVPNRIEVHISVTADSGRRGLVTYRNTTRSNS
jgi:hypothetical protein